MSCMGMLYNSRFSKLLPIVFQIIQFSIKFVLKHIICFDFWCGILAPFNSALKSICLLYMCLYYGSSINIYIPHPQTHTALIIKEKDLFQFTLKLTTFTSTTTTTNSIKKFFLFINDKKKEKLVVFNLESFRIPIRRFRLRLILLLWIWFYFVLNEMNERTNAAKRFT